MFEVTNIVMQATIDGLFSIVVIVIVSIVVVVRLEG
jgi:hypothetical protein